MPSRLATSLTVKLCGGNSFFNTVSFLSGEYRVTHSSLALCSINDDLMRVTTSLTQGEGFASAAACISWHKAETVACAFGKNRLAKTASLLEDVYNPKHIVILQENDNVKDC